MIKVMIDALHQVFQDKRPSSTVKTSAPRNYLALYHSAVKLGNQ